MLQSIISYDELTINLAGDTVTNQFNDCYNELCDFFTHLPTSAGGHSNSEVGPVSSSTASIRLFDVILVDLKQENNEALMRKEAIQELVSQIFVQQHGKKQLLLIRIVSKLVMNRIVEVRLVCEFMIANLVYFGHNSSSSSSSSSAPQLVPNLSSNHQLSANNLNPNTPGNPGSNVPTNTVTSTSANASAKATPPFIWCKIVECIIRFIPAQDYKTCRDIFKMLLEVVKRIPHANSSFPAHYDNERSALEKRKANQEDIRPISPSTASDIMLDSLYQVV